MTISTEKATYKVSDLAEATGFSDIYVYKMVKQYDLPLPGWAGWSQEQFDQLKDVINQGSRTKKHEMTIMVGADPEFEIFSGDDGRLIPAYRYFGQNGYNAAVGTDGHSTTGEIRPSPGSPERVTEHVRKLLRRIRTALPDNYTIGAGAGRQLSLGGHIHISGRYDSETLSHALDVFIGRPLNQKSNHAFRKAVGYGEEGYLRSQPHGWEYRSPCSWIAHPDLTRGALTIAWCLSGLDDGQITALAEDRDALIEMMGPIRGATARKFYDTLEEVDKIEAIQVFRAWELAEEDPKVPATLNQSPIERIPFAADDLSMAPVADMKLHYMHRDISWGGDARSLKFVGASGERVERRSVEGSALMIFFPDAYSYRPRNTQIVGGRIEVARWRSAQGHIGLSLDLREKMAEDSSVKWTVKGLVEEWLYSNNLLRDLTVNS